MPQLIVGDKICWASDGVVYEITNVGDFNYQLRWYSGHTSSYVIKSLDELIRDGRVKVNGEMVEEHNSSKTGKCKCELDILMGIGCQCGGK